MAAAPGRMPDRTGGTLFHLGYPGIETTGKGNYFGAGSARTWPTEIPPSTRMVCPVT